jgi:FAD/FMN-containing dehydrogenase
MPEFPLHDILSLPIQGTVLTSRSGAEYAASLRRFPNCDIMDPKCIVQPFAFSDIAIILSYASSQSPPIEIAVKSGGNGCPSWTSSEDGLVIDLARLNNVIVSEDKRTVKVQGGALWGDVYREARKAGVHVVGAHFQFMGVGGFLLSGGYSRLSTNHGLGLDNILAATVVLADGRVVKTSATEEPDLFWAIRGVSLCTQNDSS